MGSMLPSVSCQAFPGLQLFAMIAEHAESAIRVLKVHSNVMGLLEFSHPRAVHSKEQRAIQLPGRASGKVLHVPEFCFHRHHHVRLQEQSCLGWDSTVVALA